MSPEFITRVATCKRHDFLRHPHTGVEFCMGCHAKRSEVEDALQIHELQCRVHALELEVQRLLRGDFTPEEFQNLCHHRNEKPGCTREEFEAGCREYQRRLFGATPTTIPHHPNDPDYPGSMNYGG